MRQLTRSYKNRVLLAVLGFNGILASTAFAGGPPVAFDNYTVANGAISVGACPSASTLGLGATAVICKPGVEDNGMLQREITITGGVNAGTYIQFVLTDAGVSGDGQAAPFTAARGSLNFANEDFVKMNHRGAGIASKQTLIDSSMSATPGIEQRFVNTHDYLFGWAQNTANPWIHSFQEISTVDYNNVDPITGNPTESFNSTSDIISNGPLFGTNLSVDIDQYVDLTDQSGSGAQQFSYHKRSGIYQQTTNPTNPVLVGGSNGGNINWNNGDSISALWIGQNILSNSPGLASNALFSNTRLINNDLGGITSLTSLSSNLPVTWINPPFGSISPITPPKYVSATATVTASTGLTSTVAASAPASGATTPGVGAPLGYDNWTVSNGVFTAGTCPVSTGVTCGAVIVNERGLFQRLITKGGITFIQTIVTDTAATGDPTSAAFSAGSLAFKNETFVKYRDPVSGTTGTGIASNLHIDQQDLAYQTVSSSTPLPTTGGKFSYDTQIKTGWANGGPTDPTLIVDQRILVEDALTQNTSSMDNIYHMELGQTQADKKIRMSTVVGTFSQIGSPSATSTSSNTFTSQAACLANFNFGQSLGFIDAAAIPTCTLVGAIYTLSWTIPGAASSGFINPIVFDTTIAQGALQNTTHALTDPALLNNGGNIAWNPGDAIQATWVAGAYLTTDPFGPAQLSTTSYTNLSTGTGVHNTFVTGPPGTSPLPNQVTGPDSWVSPFTPPSLTYSTSYVAPPF